MKKKPIEIGCCKYCKIPIRIYTKLIKGKITKTQYCSINCKSKFEYSLGKFSKCKSPYTIDHWLEKGFTKEEAKIKIKERRPVNIEYWLLKGLALNQAIESIKDYQQQMGNKASLKKKNNPEKYTKSNNTNIEYYLEKTNGNLEEAEKLLKERQSTFSLKKCIEKYGEEEGLKRFNTRQEKWQNALNLKSLEEIERINRKKIFKNSYSRMSQELFWILYNKIINDFKDIYFATLQKEMHEKNNEYIHIFEDKSVAFLDFYIKDLKLIIEFDGVYWHSSPEKQISDRIREQKLINDGYIIYRVSEKDWLDNKNNIIEGCLNFIYENSTRKISAIS